MVSYLWQKRITKPSSVTDLTVDARRVLGIMGACRQLSLADLCKATHIKLPKLMVLLLEIQDSTHPIITIARKRGLPLDASVSIFDGGPVLRCRVCGQSLSKVPCSRCSPSEGEDDALPQSWYNERPQSKNPTTLEPGSQEKIELMRKRHSQGLSVFCDGDVQVTGTRRSRCRKSSTDQ